MKMISLLAFVFIFECFAQGLESDSPDDRPQLRIVELVAKGSVLMNELNIKSDWIKLENYGQDTIHLSDHKIYITDDVSKLKKFRLKKKSIAPQSSLIIWCDDIGVTRDQIHTNFKLSSMGETVTLSMKEDSRMVLLDQVYYEELGVEAQQTLRRSESKLLVYDKRLESLLDADLVK
jgi:hypothetical protein